MSYLLQNLFNLIILLSFLFDLACNNSIKKEKVIDQTINPKNEASIADQQQKHDLINLLDKGIKETGSNSDFSAAFTLDTSVGKLSIANASSCNIIKDPLTANIFDVHAIWPPAKKHDFYFVDIQFISQGCTTGTYYCEKVISNCQVFIGGPSYDSKNGSSCPTTVTSVSANNLTIKLDKCIVQTSLGKKITVSGILSCIR